MSASPPASAAKKSRASETGSCRSAAIIATYSPCATASPARIALNEP
jgi:hypothetical protein